MPIFVKKPVFMTFEAFLRFQVFLVGLEELYILALDMVEPTDNAD
jgi:hypothetical protein